jgi:cell division septation protein DedD
VSEFQRYRVTGGVFLIAVAVIVLPMLFDAKGIEPDPLPPIESVSMELATLPPLELDEVALARADELRESVDDQGFHRDTSTRIGDVVIHPATDADADGLQAVWGVQLASFSDRDNATALRNRVRDDGYPALLSRVKRLTGARTRVAIGPILSRSEADDLRQELSRRYNLDAIVVRLGT